MSVLVKAGGPSKILMNIGSMFFKNVGYRRVVHSMSTLSLSSIARLSFTFMSVWTLV